MNCLRGSFAPYWQSIQRALFPQLEPVLGPLTGKQQQLVQTLEVIRIEQWIPRCFRVPGRPRKDRAALARAFVAKAVYDMPTTRVLLDRLVTDVALRRICGWERKSEVPSESVFSRAFVEFSDTQLPQRTHAALIRNTHHDRLVGHLCRDSTAIEAREKPAAKEKTPPLPKRKRGRPKKGEERPKVLKRLDRQAAMTLPAMLDDLPTDCDVGIKKDSKGYKSTWVGYKLHLDVADGQIPISCLLRGCCMVRPRNRSGVEVVDDYTVTAEDCALPSANILFSTVHPIIASRCCASNPLARWRPPRIRLYRRNVPSTRACCR